MIGRVRGEGRTPWDRPRAGSRSEMIRAGGELQPRGAVSRGPSPSAVPHSLDSPRCRPRLRTRGSLKKFPSSAFVFSDKMHAVSFGIAVGRPGAGFPDSFIQQTLSTGVQSLSRHSLPRDGQGQFWVVNDLHLKNGENGFIIASFLK